MSKSYSLVLLVFTLPFFSFSQSGNQVIQDSLAKIYKLSGDAVRNYDYNESIRYSLELIQQAAEANDYLYLYHGYNNLGVSYEHLKDSLRAKDSYETALEYAILSENDTILWWAYNNLGNVFSENETTVEKGLEYYDKAIEIATRLEDEENGVNPVINKGWTHLDLKEYDQAFPYLLKAEKMLETSENNRAKAQLFTLFGRYYSGKGDVEESRCAFETAVGIVEKDTLILEAAVVYEEFADMLFRNGEFKDAYTALEKHLDYQGRIYEEEKLHQMEAAYTRFETAQYRENLEASRREQVYKDEVIQKSQQLSIIMVISTVVMLLFLVLVFRSNGIRKKLIRQLREKNTELTEAKEKAEKLSLLKTRFFSTVSHELRTPLYGVVGLTSLLLEDSKNKEQTEDLKSLKFSADYLLALINDVLQMNKMESQLVHLEKMPFNIKDLMTGIVKSFEFTKNQNENVIELHLDDEIPKTLVGDSVRLSQVIMNLVGNAIKFTERGLVWMKAECRKCEDGKCLIYFEVGDTGMGIPKSKQQEIFEEFSQLRTNNYSYQGTGLGLPIVRKLIHLFDSEIELQSQEGKGSVFSFEIAFEVEETQEVILQSEDAVQLGEEDTSRKILIVDDNRINQVVTQRILEKRDFFCGVATDGFQAIEILQRESFDVVLMDVNMPGMNGMETTRKIRTFNKEIPVIALTAVEIQEMREEILASGMNDIIVKPYDIPQFFNTIFRNLLAPVA